MDVNAFIENNPVKAKMVENATDYKYSSAMCHAGLVNNSLVTEQSHNTILACLGMSLF
jgi:hypothetical protein